MKYTIALFGTEGYLYGAAMIEKEYISCYCVPPAVEKLIKETFPGAADIEIDSRYRTVSVTLGGKAPYRAEFYYKCTDNTIHITE